MIGFDTVTRWVLGSLLLSLRVTPLFVFAPPFTLIRLPKRFGMLLGIALSASMISGRPDLEVPSINATGLILSVAAHEIALGVTFVIAFQLLFGALYFAGRTVDIQSGFGLAMVLDPANHTQIPLVGTLFGYLVSATFFAVQGHLGVLRLMSASLDAIPLGAGLAPTTIQPLLTYIAALFTAAIGMAGVAILVLFLADLSIAMIARTVPQMNVLVFGFQVKTIVLFTLLPVMFGMSGAMITHILTLVFSSLPTLL